MAQNVPCLPAARTFHTGGGVVPDLEDALSQADRPTPAAAVPSRPLTGAAPPLRNAAEERRQCKRLYELVRFDSAEGARIGSTSGPRAGAVALPCASAPAVSRDAGLPQGLAASTSRPDPEPGPCSGACPAPLASTGARRKAPAAAQQHAGGRPWSPQVYHYVSVRGRRDRWGPWGAGNPTARALPTSFVLRPREGQRRSREAWGRGQAQASASLPTRSKELLCP